ncbi:MAG TPA: FMN-binding protein [Streptosporangiaceae bacterium]|nr:FMN-binding protein [Streptosporangiaceae bacterium]
MKRAPIVIAGTVAGLVAVLEFHTTPAKLTLAGGSSLAAGSSAAPATAGGAGTTTQPASGATTSPGAASGQANARTATGPQINYNFGVLSVKVTVSGGKIRKVGIAYLDDGGNPRSQFIDQQSIPILEQEALAAQSANIQGVSGASFTSAGFTQSLQSALHSLGM